MADFTKSVELIFGGKDNVSPTIKNITRSLDDFDSKVQTLAQPVGQFADSVLKIDAALLAVGATMVAFAVGEAVRFESAQLDLQKVLGESEGSVDQYASTIRDLSLEYGVLKTDTTNSAAEFKQANFTIEESLRLVEAALIATKISELDANEASQLLKTTIKGFGLEAADVVGVLDTWNEASNNFNTNTREIALGLSDLAPIAAQVGLSLDETASLLLPIIERFGSGSEAAIALKAALLGMVSPSTAQALDDLGISQRDANGEIRNAGDILRDVQVAYQTLTPEQQLYNTGLLVGKNQAARLTPVLSDLNGTLEAQEVLAGKSGSAMEELAVRMQATEISIDRLKTAFSSAQEAIGKNFLTGVKGSAEALKELLISIEDVVNDGGLAPLFNLMQPLFEEFNKDVAAIAKNLPEAFAGVDFSGLIKAFESLGGELGGILSDLFGDFDIETVAGLETVLQGTVDGITALINVTRGIFQELQPIFETIGEVIQRSSGLGEETELAFGRFLGAGKLISDFGTTMGATLLIVRETGTDIKNVFDVIIGSAKFALNSLQVAFDILALAVVETFKQLSEVAKNLTFGDTSAYFAQVEKDLALTGQAIQSNITKNALEARAGLDQIGQGFGIVAEDVETDTQSIATSVGAITSASVESTQELNKAGLSLEEVFAAAGQAIDPVTGQITTLSTATAEAGNEATFAKEKQSAWTKTVVDGVATFTQSGSAIKKSFTDIADGADEAKKKSDEVYIKLQEIASNERIKTIEANVNLNIAGLEADAKVAVAIIDELGSSIGDTTKLIGDLFGLFVGNEDRFKDNAILRQITLENENRKKQLELEALLVQAQVNNLEAKTDALREGNGLITITADGLEPELEAFMMAVLRRVQVKAAEDQSLYLLGLPAVA